MAALSATAHATVTNIAWYRLGENDPGAASGLAVTNTTIDAVGTKHLKQFGSPLCSNAPAVPQPTPVCAGWNHKQESQVL